jgi:hypothetical protein
MKMQGAQVGGRHLLAYCYLKMEVIEKAFKEFKHCVKGKHYLFYPAICNLMRIIEGMAEDWQMLVELAIEMEEPSTPTQRRKSDDTENGYEII